MLLAIEQGNTNTLFAVHDGETWIAQWRAATESTRTADEYAVWLSQLLTMQGLALGVLTGCIISSVVPQSIFNLRNLARRYLKVEPLVIGENVELGVEVRIHKPSEAGADRLVNAVGAHIKCKDGWATGDVERLLVRAQDDAVRALHPFAVLRDHALRAGVEDAH